ncbi:MAG: hypothetical protein Q9162_004759 [Coniocarpon cinnabarinum]
MAAKHQVNLADEPEQRRKLVKLDHNVDSDHVSGPQDEDKETDLGVDGEDAENAAARAVAEKRSALERDNMKGVEKTQDVQVNGVTSNGASTAADEDEVDPLDAYMAGLSEAKSRTTRAKPNLQDGGRREALAYFSDDEDIMTAVDDNSGNILEATKKNVKKKDLPSVDHAKMKYESFRKDFYTEPAELAQLSEDEVLQMRRLDDIKVRGQKVPRPVQNFAQCGLGVSSLNVIASLGFDAPTAIQSQAIPVIMSGRDVIGIAKTGSGKTIAFLLPMFRHIKDQRPLKAMEGPVGLVVSPTRELATQIHRECRPWLKALGLRAMCAYGGAPISEQIAELKRGAEIIVCTPGRMIDLLAANSGRVTNLKRVTYCVLDEADRMFDLGFGPQIKMILDRIRPSRQTVMFSATFPQKMDDLARNVLKKPVEITVGGRAVVGSEITQLVEVKSTDSEKFQRLMQLLGEVHNDDDARSLVFVDRQDSAEKLASAIMRKGYPCNAIHGQKDQYDRDSIISDFKAGIFPVLVATSVAARGLDVKQLRMVVNFDCPNHLEDYVHRAGRTGRAGNTGTAVTFITPEQERYSPDILKALKQSNAEVPEPLQNMADGFLKRVKSGAAKAALGGFGGKGLDEIDQKRDAEKIALRKLHKTEDEPDEPDGTEEDAGLESLEKFKVNAKAETDHKKEEPNVATPTNIPSHISLDPSQIKVEKTEPQDAEPKKTKLSAAEIAKARIDARLRKAGDIRGTAPIDNKGPDAGAFHSTLEINDFPQKARWAVTNRTNVAKILEHTGTSITTKGNYYAQGKEPNPQNGDLPKLYILVEGDTEVVVTNAMRELMELLKSACIAAADAESRAPTSITSKYNIA